MPHLDERLDIDQCFMTENVLFVDWYRAVCMQSVKERIS